MFGGGTFYAWTISSGVHQVSIALEEDSGIPVEDVVRDFSAEAIGRELSALSISGTGTSQPLGVMTAANTQRAWSAGNSGGGLFLSHPVVSSQSRTNCLS